jgi:hypothetical protein
VSRRFVAATQKKLATWLGRDLGSIELAAKKHVLGIHEGATENTAACGALLDDIIARGVATKRSKLFVIDGSKALVKAIRDRFGERALIQRCQIHKKRNVRDHLPEYMRSSVSSTMSQAYQTRDAVRATKLLENLARSLDAEHPGLCARGAGRNADGGAPRTQSAAPPRRNAGPTQCASEERRTHRREA